MDAKHNHYESEARKAGPLQKSGAAAVAESDGARARRQDIDGGRPDH
jgi:hypothetical protein